MADQRFAIFDGDGHVLESDDELAQYYEGEDGLVATKRLSCMSIFPSHDGWPRGFTVALQDTKRTIWHTDAEIWNQALERFGMEGSVLFPSIGLTCGLIRDPQFAAITATAYNNWLEDRYTRRNDRLYGVGMIPIGDPEAAVREIRRCATERKNFKAILLPAATAAARAYGDEFYWPIYAEAQARNMPIVLHGGPSDGVGLDYLEPFAKVQVLSHPVKLFIHMTDIVLGGVFDAFPDLRIGFLEAGCSWVPFMVDRLDWIYGAHSHGARVRKMIKRRPSEYLREGDNFWVAAELEDSGLKYTIDCIGSERIFYASDFPHEPTEAELAGTVADFVDDPAYSDEVKANILCNNGKRFYGID